MATKDALIAEEGINLGGGSSGDVATFDKVWFKNFSLKTLKNLILSQRNRKFYQK